MSQFIRDRNEAMFSLDEGRILAYAEKYGVQLPNSPDAFWGGVYKSVIALNATEDVQAKARAWLDAKGWSHNINN